MFFLGCQDDTPRKTIEDKIRDGAAAYQKLFHAPANVCVCSAANVAAVGGRVGLIDVGVAIDNKPPWIDTPNLFLLGQMGTAEALGDYRQARGALQSNGPPSEVVMRRMRDGD
jgi:hypothetical protein